MCVCVCVCVVWFQWFYGISIFVGYLMPKRPYRTAVILFNL